MMQPCSHALFALMFAQVVALGAAAPAVIRSHSHARGQSSDNSAATAVELSARGEGHFAKGGGGRNLCANSCEIYAGGATTDTEQVCMDQDGECSVPMAGCPNVCTQRFELECEEHCSEWSGSADESTLNVCQDNARPWKCHKSAQCEEGYTRCKQKQIPLCHAMCEGYVGYDAALEKEIGEDSQLVCQVFGKKAVDLPKQMSEKYYAYCVNMPCFTTAIPQKFSSPCRQIFDICPHVCPGGTFENNRTDGVTCWDPVEKSCSNDIHCAGTRCTERTTEDAGTPDYSHDKYRSNAGGDR